MTVNYSVKKIQLTTGGLITLSQLKKVISGLSFQKSEKNQYILCQLVKKYNRIKSLEKGYAEMASINLSIAKMCFDADNDCLRQCEEKLTECE